MGNKEDGHFGGSLLLDFYIDLLGSLAPGLLVLLLTSVVLGFSLLVLGNALNPNETAFSLLAGTNYFGLGTYGVAGILLVSSYIFGSLFFKQDPKIPDWKSARRIYNHVPEGERARLAVQPTSTGAQSQTITTSDAQFPYFFLYEYLVGRGLEHLARMVPWQGRDRCTWKYRSKMFINLLKIRLQFLVPEKCKEIVRNEAHVRMSTSMWYATNWLMEICVIGFAIFGVALFVSGFRFDLFVFLNGATNLLVFLFALFIKAQIENYIHYLRVREIVYVLETAYFASLNGTELHLDELARTGEAAEGAEPVPQRPA